MCVSIHMHTFILEQEQSSKELEGKCGCRGGQKNEETVARNKLQPSVVVSQLLFIFADIL